MKLELKIISHYTRLLLVVWLSTLMVFGFCSQASKPWPDAASSKVSLSCFLINHYVFAYSLLINKIKRKSTSKKRKVFTFKIYCKELFLLERIF